MDDIVSPPHQPKSQKHRINQKSRQDDLHSGRICGHRAPIIPASVNTPVPRRLSCKCCAGDGAMHCPRGYVDAHRRRRGRRHHSRGSVRRADRRQFSSFVVWFVVVGFGFFIRIRRRVRHRRIRLRQQIRRPSATDSSSASTSGVVQSSGAQAVRPPHRVTLRRQTHALELCSSRGADQCDHLTE